MCCLRYEQEAYEDLLKHVPKNGAFVQTEDGYGNVTLVNLLRQNVKVKLDGPGEAQIRTYDADEIAEIPGGRPAEGQPLPDLLRSKPKKIKEDPVEPEVNGCIMPSARRSARTAFARLRAEQMKAPVSRETGAFFYSCLALERSTPRKCSLVILIITGLSAKSAMKFGIAMRPLSVSAMFHTKSSEETLPITITMTKMS